MSIEIVFPEPKSEVIVETKMVEEIIGSTMYNHRGGGMSCWSGNSGIGKTTTATLMESKVREAYNRDPTNSNAFLAKYYTVGEIERWSGNEQKRGIKSLYLAIAGSLDEGEYIRLPSEQLAADLVYTAKRKRIKMVFIDEAGCLSIDAIRGMVLVRDISHKEGWTISLIFIGMDDLPIKLNSLPQVDRRVEHWCYFNEYDFDDTWTLLSELHPHFKSDRKDENVKELVEFVHESFGGYPGLIVPFINQLEYFMTGLDREIDLKTLRTVHYSMTSGKSQAIEDAANRMKRQSKPGSSRK
jgi:hypothetical protein